MNETIKVINSRRSIRQYKPQQIADAEIQAIMETAIHAPSAMNQQKWHFTVIQNPEVLAKMEDVVRQNMLKSDIEFIANRARENPDAKTFYNAPTVIIVTAEENAHFTDFDCGAAAENIAVAACSLGIGSCMIGFGAFLFGSEKEDEIKKELGIPEGYRFIISIALGYKDIDPPVPPKNRDVINYVK
jgi:nitroreductase